MPFWAVGHEVLGGRAVVLRRVERFYDLMEQTDLLGWLGGPDDYVRQHGHPRLRMRHGGVAVTLAMRDAWLRCMYAALDEEHVSAATRAFLRQRFAKVADFMRNVDETG